MAGAGEQHSLSAEDRRRRANEVREAAAMIEDIENAALGVATLAQSLASRARGIRRTIVEATTMPEGDE